MLIFSNFNWNLLIKEKGVRFGIPKVVTPPNTNDVLLQFINKEITNNQLLFG